MEALKVLLFIFALSLGAIIAPQAAAYSYRALCRPLMLPRGELFKAFGRLKDGSLNWLTPLKNCVGAVGLAADQTLSETQRTLETALAFVSSGVAATKVPLDSTFRGISVRGSGVTTTTFGSPVQASQLATLDNLIQRLEVSVAGGRIIKSTMPHIMHMQQILATQIQGERKASAGAAAAYNNNPTADGGFVYGTTTQISTFAETVYIPFEMILCAVGREKTWLVTKGLSQADLRFYFNSINSLDLTTNCTFSATSIAFEIVTVEARDYQMKSMLDWRQTTSSELFSSQATDRIVKLNAGNRMLGLSFHVLQDSSGADGTTSNRKKPNNNSLRQIRLRRNGREFYATTFQSLQAQNRARFGASAAFASNVSRLDGFAYLDLTTERILDTALELRSDRGINTFEVVLTTAASDATSNIYPITVNIEQGELVEVPAYA